MTAQVMGHCSPEQWAAEVLSEAKTMARRAGDMPEEAVVAHVHACWLDAGATADLADAVADATRGALELELERETPTRFEISPF